MTDRRQSFDLLISLQLTGVSGARLYVDGSDRCGAIKARSLQLRTSDN